MGLHRYFYGDRTECAKYYPFALRKLDELRAHMKRAGVLSFSRKYDNSLGDVVRIQINGSEEMLEIRAGGDGYYCLGDLGGPDYYISASRHAIGAFRPRGEVGFASGPVPSLNYVGRGYGSTSAADTDNGVTTLEVYETWSGVAFTHVFTYSTDDGFAFMVASAVAPDEVTYGFTSRRYIDGEAYGLYHFTLDGANSWTTQSTGYGGGYAVGTPKMIRYGPRLIWGFVPTYKNDFNNDPRLSYIWMSEDNGQGFTLPGTGDLVSDVNDDDDDAVFNIGIEQLRNSLTGVRLNTGDLLMVAQSQVLRDTSMSPMVYRAGADGEPWYVATLVFMDDSQAGPIALLSQGKPVIIIHPNDPLDVPYFFVGSEDGTSWTERTMPWPSYRTGTAAAIDQDTVVCTTYNPDTGHYELHQTTDLGQNWEYRATVRTDAPAPPDGTPLMERFGVLAILRQNGRPANSFPGQPWVGDNQITPPWEA